VTVSVSLVTYSTKPRGGVVHTLAVAEALQDAGADVRVVALGNPSEGFFRPVRTPTTIVPGPSAEGTLEHRVAGSIDRLTDVLAHVGAPLLHAQDCISARAAARVRDARTGSTDVRVLRTVHHIDDFSSQVLMDCQRQAVLEPDVVLTVSETWRRQLAADYGVSAQVVPNGVAAERFSSVPAAAVEALRLRYGIGTRQLLLSVGGIEPRKGTDSLVRALPRLAHAPGVRPVLAVVGGHSFQDHRWYHDAVLAELPGLGLRLGVDVLAVGTVDDQEMPAWFAAADVLAFPSVKEGFGLAVLEAMSAGTPVVTSDLPVFREYLVDGRDALLVPVGDVDGLARALSAAMRPGAHREALVRNGRRLASRFTWAASARRHLAIYGHEAEGHVRAEPVGRRHRQH
jgi:glycosyltransferase-like protein